MSGLLIIGFIGLFGLKSLGKFFEDCVTITKYEVVPEEISSPSKFDTTIHKILKNIDMLLVIYGLIYTKDRSSNVASCLQQNSTLEFDKCLEEQQSRSIKFEEIYLKPYKSSKFITSFGFYEPILPEEGVIGFQPFKVSMSFNNTEDYQFSLYDKNFFFPTRNYQSVPRTVFRINKHTGHYQISFQVVKKIF